MDTTTLRENVERLVSAFENLLCIYPEAEDKDINVRFDNISDISTILNSIFDESKCVNAIFTKNTDKMFFGIRVNPSIDKNTLLEIIETNNNIDIGHYEIEFDSKIFSIGLNAVELTAYTLFEISSMVDSYEVFNSLREIIDVYLTSTDDTINLRNSMNYSQLIIFAIKDTLTKLSSLIYKEDETEIATNNLVQELDLLDILVDTHKKITTSEIGSSDLVRTRNYAILRWMFTVYRSMDTNSNIVRDTLKDARDITGSKLDQKEINKTINAISNIDNSIVLNNESSDLISFLEASNVKILDESLFGGLKRRGLRSLEDDLYVFSMQVKNLETENDAIYVLRSINTRLNILDDYLYENEDLSETERARWASLSMKYRQLRENLIKKKIWNKKNYGLFFDYNQMYEGDPED
jgi:hypothetical protein